MTLAEEVGGWDPAPTETTEVLDPGPALGLAGLLDGPSPLDGPLAEVPVGWQILYFLDRSAQRDLGADGHPLGGPFLPPIERRRRMFAGGRLTWRGRLPLAAAVERRSEVAGTRLVDGRSGEMFFVTVRHVFVVDGQVVVEEEQDLVYRQAPAEPAPVGPGQPDAPAGTAADPVDPRSAGWPSVSVATDPTVLFRFSALTYNSHRIHYDLGYARREEGYPALVVHGPLMAVLGLEPVRRQAASRPITGFSYRLRRPAFSGPRLVASVNMETGEVLCGSDGQAPSLTGTLTFG